MEKPQPKVHHLGAAQTLPSQVIARGLEPRNTECARATALAVLHLVEKSYQTTRRLGTMQMLASQVIARDPGFQNVECARASSAVLAVLAVAMHMCLLGHVDG